MYQAQKLSAHITLLEQRRTKITAYYQEVMRTISPDPQHQTTQDRRRVMDIEASIKRLDNQITQYQQKLALVRSLEK